MQPNTKIVNLLKTFFFLLLISFCVFNVWPKATLLLPVWLRDTKRLDSPALESIDSQNGWECIERISYLPAFVSIVSGTTRVGASNDLWKAEKITPR